MNPFENLQDFLTQFVTLVIFNVSSGDFKIRILVKIFDCYKES